MEITFIVGLVIILLGLFLIIIKFGMKKKTPVDYYSIFIMGVIWLIIGIPLNNSALWELGFIFTIIGLVNKDNWRKDRYDWSKLSRAEIKTRIIIISVGVILAIAGIIVLIVSK
ncbi:Uncharacterised protein [Candidatus Tiddalikarchaeum anstoanum]|nr:Uncharacterised protein [Candidatus Tiddalikarchaeum anstoanum]